MYENIKEHVLADIFDEWALPLWEEWGDTGRRLYEFYNVMYIEWEDGVAYRVAVGRVEKAKWESISKEEIDVVLG